MMLNIVLHQRFEIDRISALWVKDCHDEQTLLPLFSRVLVFKHSTASPFGDW